MTKSTEERINLSERFESGPRYGILSCGGRWDRKLKRTVPKEVIQPLLTAAEQEKLSAASPQAAVKSPSISPTIVHSQAGW